MAALHPARPARRLVHAHASSASSSAAGEIRNRAPQHFLDRMLRNAPARSAPSSACPSTIVPRINTLVVDAVIGARHRRDLHAPRHRARHANRGDRIASEPVLQNATRSMPLNSHISSATLPAMADCGPTSIPCVDLCLDRAFNERRKVPKADSCRSPWSRRHTRYYRGPRTAQPRECFTHDGIDHLLPVVAEPGDRARIGEMMAMLRGILLRAWRLRRP